MTREELLKSPEYWILEIQMKLYKVIDEFMKNNNINQNQLAEKLGFTKGYISQILNGDYNHRISKLVKLALSVGKVPRIDFDDIEQILFDDIYDMLDRPKSERPVINLYFSLESGITLPENNVEEITHKNTNLINEEISLTKLNSFTKYEKDKILA
jgi:transcriptional regulator with XRE-family HTH domain